MASGLVGSGRGSWAAILLASAGMACSSHAASSAGTTRFSGTYIATNDSTSAEFAPLVLDDTGHYRATRGSCISACVSEGTFTYDGANDLALTDAKTGATQHVDVANITTEPDATSTTTTAKELTTKDVAPLGTSLVGSSSGSLVQAAHSETAARVASASLNGQTMARKADPASPIVFMNLPVGAQGYASDWATAYNRPGQWPSTLGMTDVIQLWEAEIAPIFMQPNQLMTTVSNRHLAISVEATPLENWWCKPVHGYPVSGSIDDQIAFVASNTAADMNLDFQPIYDAGGFVTYAAQDSDGISTVTSADPGDLCHFTVEQAVTAQIQMMQAVHAKHPEIQFGLIPNFPNYNYNGVLCWDGDPNDCDAEFPGRDYRDVLRTQVTMIRQAGEQVTFLHVDNPYKYILDNTVPDSFDTRLVPLRDQAANLGLSFGLIVNTELAKSVHGAAGDQAFHDQVLAESQFIAQSGLGDEDDFLIESWFDYPSLILPETKANTFTSVANGAILTFNQASGR